MISALDVARNLVRSFMPDGFFWRGEAGDRFVEAMANSWADSVQFIADLTAAIDPARTPHRSVLLQYWAYFDNDCIAIPIDTEELRTLVLAFLSIRAIETPAGQEAFIEGLLPLAEFAESLPVSWIPADVPFLVEPTGRVIQIWYPPLIYPAEYINCIARPVTQAADAIQHATPGGVVVSVYPHLVQDVGVHWHFVRGEAARLRIVVEHTTGTILADDFYAITDEFGVDTLDNMIGLAATDELEQTRITVTVQRDYLDGAGYRDLAEFIFDHEGYMSDIFAAADILSGTVIQSDGLRNIATATPGGVGNVTMAIVFTEDAIHANYGVHFTTTTQSIRNYQAINRTVSGFDIQITDETDVLLDTNTEAFQFMVVMV